MKHLMICLSMIAATVLGGCTAQKKSSDPTPLAVGSFAQSWAADFELPSGDSIAELHLREDLLFAYTQNRTVYVLNRKSGQLLHIDKPVAPGARLRPPIVIVDETDKSHRKDRIVYLSDASVVVYDYYGKLQRNIKLPFPISSDGIGYKSDVFFGVDNPTSGRFAAINLDASYVPLRWEVYTYGNVQAAPAVQSGTAGLGIYAGTTDGRVFAITVTRNPIWPFDTGFRLAPGARILADLKVDESGVYVAGTDGKLLCLDRAYGKVQWQYFAGTSLTSSPFLSPENVYLHVKGTGLVALPKFTGDYNRNPKWTHPDALKILAEDGKYCYALMNGKQIAALDPASGEVRFANSRKDLAAFAVNPSTSYSSDPREPRVYAATAKGQVVGIFTVNKPGLTGDVAQVSQPLAPIAAAR